MASLERTVTHYQSAFAFLKITYSDVQFSTQNVWYVGMRGQPHTPSYT